MSIKHLFWTILLVTLCHLSLSGQTIADSLGLTGTAADTVVANRLFGEMKELIKEEHLEIAEAKGEEAQKIYERVIGEKSQQMADIWYQFGTIWQSQGKYNQAVQAGEKAVNIALETIGPEHLTLSHYYNNLGGSLMSIGKYSEALNYFYKSLSIRLKLLKPAHIDVATSYYNLGYGHVFNGDYESGIDFIQKALNIQLNILGTNHYGVAKSYNLLGIAYYNMNQNEKSIAFYKKGLNMQLKETGTESLMLSYIYNNLGNSYNAIGNYDRAIEVVSKSLDLFPKSLGIDHPGKTRLYNNLANSYGYKGEYKKSIEFHKKALNIQIKNSGEENPVVALFYYNLGNSNIFIGKYDTAIIFLQKALDIHLKTLGVYHDATALCYNNLGTAYLRKKDYKKAIEFLQKSLEIYLKVFGGENADVARVYNHFGDLCIAEKEYDIAIAHFKKSLIACNYINKAFAKVNSSEHLLTSLSSLIQALKMQYAKTHVSQLIAQSHDYCLQALAAIDYQQSTFTEEGSKAFWFEKNYPIYEQAIDISLLKANVDKNDTLRRQAFNYAEKSKSNLLQAQIKETTAFSRLPDSLLYQEHELRTNITYREKQRQALLDKGLAETDTIVLAIISKSFDLRRQYEALKDTFEAQYPGYYRLKYDRSTVSLNYVHDTLLQSGQTLLEYFTGDSAIYVFTVRPDTFNVTEIKKDFPLEDWVAQLRHGLYDYYQSGSVDPVYYDSTAREYSRAAYQLYTKLIAPVASLLTDNVIVVPDGALGYVPFEALLTKKPEAPRRFYSHAYFGKDRRISYAYSATLLREMRDKQHKTEPTGTLLALAPFFRDDAGALREQLDTLSELIALRSDTLTALRNSGREALVAEKIFKGQALLGVTATKDTFQHLAGQYRIVHLSTHGKANDRIGDYAYLGFGLPGSATTFDKLYVKDIYNLSLNADLVVLSACETGIGQLQRGEGIISLARAFAYAGAKSIVTTLWQVDDARTSKLMQGFYKNLRQGLPKDEALWRAKRQLFMESKADAHPFFWAGFIPIGDMRALKN